MLDECERIHECTHMRTKHAIPSFRSKLFNSTKMRAHMNREWKWLWVQLIWCSSNENREKKSKQLTKSFAHKCTWFCQNLAYIWHSIKQNLKSPIDWHSALICRYYIRSMCFVNGKFFKIRLLRCQSQLMLWGTRVSLLPLIHLLFCILEILSVDDIFISFCYRHFTLRLSSDLLCFL